MTQPRKPKGTSSGGQFDEKRHSEAASDLSTIGDMKVATCTDCEGETLNSIGNVCPTCGGEGQVAIEDVNGDAETIGPAQWNLRDEFNRETGLADDDDLQDSAWQDFRVSGLPFHQWWADRQGDYV